MMLVDAEHWKHLVDDDEFQVHSKAEVNTSGDKIVNLESDMNYNFVLILYYHCWYLVISNYLNSYHARLFYQC